ncbi:MAG TPA: molybdopterin cofactor-binding domain-containing protein [Anaerolineaceae bacterium]
MQKPEAQPPLLELSFWLNGNPIQEHIPGEMTLLRYLRDCAGLLGTKDGCAVGQCGTCTVIVDGKARHACHIRMAELAGSRVQTIDGLASGGAIHPLQQAFIDAGAVQCGFCTPGMIMAAKALLDANPQPTLEDVKAALTATKQLCRCTGYVKIFEAIQLAAARMHSPGAPEPAATPGLPLTESISVDMVTGRNLFCDDLILPGMLHGKILFSAEPHARIRALDTRAAERMPGVVAVITAKDIPGKNECGIVMRDQLAIASDYVRSISDTLAAVFAETREQAAAALAAIRVDYEPLPGIFTPEEAARPDAPKLHEKGNLLHHTEIRRGDVEAAFAQCAVIVEGDYTTPFVEHGFLEPEAGLGYLDQEGRVVIKIGTQAAFDDRAQLSTILGWPEEKIRVIQIPPGGAFGGKEDMVIQQFLALGALKTGKPVKIVLSREESLRGHVKRHPAWVHYKTGADSAGRVLAIEQRVTLDTGAYASLGFDVLENTIVFGAGPYYVPNLKLDGWAWYTNNIMAGSMRGFGVNQVAFALEQQMDAMARALAIDPFEFRLINGLDVGQVTASDHVLEPGVAAVKQTVSAARETFEQVRLPKPSGPHKKIGIGVASAVKNIGYGHNVPEDAGATVELSSAGSVLVRASQHEYGQGARMGLITLASSQLGIPAERIRVTVPDTAETPPTGPTTASRQTFLTGNALVLACRELKADLFGHAAEHIGADPGGLQILGEFVVDPASGRQVALRELGERFVVARRYSSPHSDGLLPEGEASHYGEPGFQSRVTHFCYAYGTQVAVVEADEVTGEVQVLSLVSANDVGKILNRQAIEGQIQGGALMGLGFALSEQFILEKGINLTDSLEKVGLPLPSATPEILCAIVEVPHPEGPDGLKGFAEAPSLATAGAIANAIYDALGVRVTSLPANPAHVLQALAERSDLRVERKTELAA